jgi:hypothetical protein
VHLGTIVGIVLAVLLVAAIILAGIYISGHPNSNAALFFIEVSVRFACICFWPASLGIQNLPQPVSSLASLGNLPLLHHLFSDRYQGPSSPGLRT